MPDRPEKADDCPPEKTDNGVIPGLNFLDIFRGEAKQEAQKCDVQAEKASKIDNHVDQLLFIYKFLGKECELNPQELLPKLELFGIKIDERAKQFLKGVTKIAKKDDHIEVTKDAPTHIEINESLLGGAASIKSLDIGNLSFDMVADEKRPALRNLNGMTLTIEALGDERQVAIRDVALDKDKDGNSVIRARVDNPFPLAVQFGLGMPSKLSIAITLDAEGKPIVKTSDALRQAADTTGFTLPGLLVNYGLDKAADIAEFVEKNPGTVDRAKAVGQGIIDVTMPLLGTAIRHPKETFDFAKIMTFGPIGSFAIDFAATNPRAATNLAKNVVLGPVGSTVVDLAVANKDVIKSTATTAAKTAFYVSPVGAGYAAYKYLFGD